MARNEKPKEEPKELNEKELNECIAKAEVHERAASSVLSFGAAEGTQRLGTIAVAIDTYKKALALYESSKELAQRAKVCSDTIASLEKEAEKIRAK